MRARTVTRAAALTLIRPHFATSRAQYWDFTLKGIDNASADASSKALFAASFAASAALAMLELP